MCPHPLELPSHHLRHSTFLGHHRVPGWVPCAIQQDSTDFSLYHKKSPVQFSHSVMPNSLRPHRLQYTRLPCPSPTPGACSNSYPFSQWCYPTISYFIVPFSSCLQFFPASGSFSMSWLFISGGQNIAASASASVLPVNVQGWSPLRLTSLTSLLSKGDSGVFSITKFEGINSLVFCLLYGPALTTICDQWEDHSLDYMDLCWQSNGSVFQHTA